MREGFNIFEAGEPEPDARGLGTREERTGGSDEQPRRAVVEPGRAGDAHEEELGGAEVDMFAAASAAQEVDERDRSEAGVGGVRRHLRMVALGALAIFVLALAGTLFGSGARRPGAEVTAPQLRLLGLPAPRAAEPTQRRDSVPTRPASRPMPRTALLPSRDQPAVERPEAGSGRVPAAEAVPVVRSPIAPAPRPARAMPRREFDFER